MAIFTTGVFRHCRLLAAPLVLTVAACGAGVSSSGVPSAIPSQAIVRSATASPIQHIVIIIQENRSVDNLFNGLPGASTVTSGLNSNGQTVQLHQVPLVEWYDLGHGHAGFLADYNNGAMNGFDKTQLIVKPGSSPPPPNPAYGYVAQSDVQPYFTMAEQYGFADHMFQSNSSGSFAGHLYLATATAAIDSTGQYNDLGNGKEPDGKETGGCDAPTGTLAALINPITNDQSHTAFPCFDHTTPWDLLDNAHLSWRWYQPRLFSGLWFTPDAIHHIRYGKDYANVVTPNTQIQTDIQNKALPAVSWVIPTGPESDHPDLTDGSGPAFVSSIVNSIGQSSYWNSTAIFVVWDDWGGWYDHVAPHQYNYEELGFRVPLLVVSPYARAHYVSKVNHEFGSIVHYIESTFNLPSLGYTDARADDLSDMFNYSQLPIPFSPIPAAKVPASARTDTRPPDND